MLFSIEFVSYLYVKHYILIRNMVILEVSDFLASDFGSHGPILTPRLPLVQALEIYDYAQDARINFKNIYINYCFYGKFTLEIKIIRSIFFSQ